MNNELSDEKWKSIMNLIDKLDDEATRLDWEELREQTADAFTYIDECESNEQILMEPYQFLYRLWLRAKSKDKKIEFDIIREEIRTGKKNTIEKYFVVYNYSWKSFLWARQHNLTEWMSNGEYMIPLSKIDGATAKQFHKRAEYKVGDFLD